MSRAHHHTGFTLVEATISTEVVGIMLVAALNVVSSARLGEMKLSSQNLGLMLAQDLISEIQQQAYEDPNGAVTFGTETGEQTSTRIDFDDVDDYHNWSQSPPLDRAGNTMTDYTGWERSVQVAWIHLNNLTQTSGSETGIKRVQITLKRNGIPVTDVSFLQTKVWPSLFADGSDD